MAVEVMVRKLHVARSSAQVTGVGAARTSVGLRVVVSVLAHLENAESPRAVVVVDVPADSSPIERTAFVSARARGQCTGACLVQPSFVGFVGVDGARDGPLIVIQQLHLDSTDYELWSVTPSGAVLVARGANQNRI